MNVYVAAKYESKDLVRETIKELVKAGHRVTHDWTFEDDSDLVGQERKIYLQKCAEADLHGVVEADAIIVYPHANGKGLYVEMGAALALCRQVIVIGDEEKLPNCIFFHLDTVVVVPDLAMAIESLENLELMDDA